MRPVLKVEELSKAFVLHALNGRRIPALDSVSFALQEGEILGLTGTSGAGKSSLMKCLYRTYIPSSGCMWFRANGDNAVDLACASEHTILQLRRRSIRYCSQFLQVIPRVAAVEVIADSLIGQGAERTQALTKAKDLLDELRFPRELWDAYPATFSGGEQQRVNMARALIARSQLLLVDEPTASLDPVSKDIVIRLIRNLRQNGTSIVLITHDEQTLNKLADRKLLLQNGRVLDSSPA